MNGWQMQLRMDLYAMPVHIACVLINDKLTTALSSEFANALDVDTSKLRPTAAAVRSKGSSISLVGLGWRLQTD